MLKEILIGVGGFTAGVLLAPTSGGEARAALASALADAIEAAGDQYDIAKETVRKSARKTVDVAGTAAEVAEEQYGRARKRARRAAKMATEFGEGVQESYSKLRSSIPASVLPLQRKRLSAGTVVSRLALGVGVGLALGMLFAPKRGAELREDIADAAQSFAGGWRIGYREQRAAAAAGAWTGTSGPDYT